jgi:peptidyl-dipeptidase A
VTSPVPPFVRPESPQRFVDDEVAALEPLRRQAMQATWDANVTGEERHVRRSAELEAAIRTRLSRPEPCRYAGEARVAAAAGEPLLRRQLELLDLAYRSNQMPPERIAAIVEAEKRLENTFNQFRAQLDGEAVGDNALREVLRSSTDLRRRQAAWEASKQVGREVRDELVALVRLRNASAAELGYSSFYSMMLELDELNEAELFGVLDRLERDTRAMFETYKRELDAERSRRFGVPVEDLRPWHYGDPFFQEAGSAEVDLDRWFADQSLEELTARFFASVGFEVRDLLARADLYEKPGKCQHAFCISIDRADDVRVLCNLQPNEQWMGTMLHEFGHAVYDVYIDRALPWLLREPAHTLATEASAMLFGRLSRNAAWLRTWAGVPAAEARAAAAATDRASREQLLVMTRWCLVMCHMERALYRDPDQDLDTLWWDLVERYQLVRRPDGRHAPDWASKIHFSVAPVYYHNYMLGEMTASQIQRRLLADVAGGGDRPGEAAWERYVTRPEIGRHLVDRLYRLGKSVDWRDAIVSATGAPLSSDAFVRELAGA